MASLPASQTPPVLLGLGMLLLGAIVTLFGFSVTRGATGTWYFVACGLAMAASGWLYFKGMKLAVPVYALTCAMTVLWAAMSVGIGLMRTPHERSALADALAEHIISSLGNLSETRAAAE